MNTGTKVVQISAVSGSKEHSSPWTARIVERIRLFLMRSKAESQNRFQDPHYLDYLETMTRLRGF